MAETLTLRLSGPRDLAAVDALLARSYPALLKRDYPPSVLVTALPRISRANPALLASGSYWLAEREGRLLGAGGFTLAGPRRARRAARVGHVRHVVVDVKTQRQGVGRALLSRVLEEARAAGVTDLRAQATRTAVPFYAAMGFEALGEIVVPLAPGIEFPAVAMRRAL